MPASKEVVAYGLTYIGSGISQVISASMSYWPLSLYLYYVGFGMVSLGALFSGLGVFWKWGPRKRPLGISLLSISFILSAFASIVLGGWIYTPLFLVSIISFAIAWALWTGRKWGKTVLEVLAVLGLLASVLGFGRINDFVVYVPGVLGSLYVFWYVDRLFVAKYFGAERRYIGLSKKSVSFVLALFLLLPVLLAFFYVYPPSRTIASVTGGSGGGTSGPELFFYRGDTLMYSFQVDPGFGPINFSIQHPVFPEIIASSYGRSGTGIAHVPLTDQYAVWFETQANYVTLHYEIVVTVSSIRTHFTQWALLDLYMIVLISFTKLQKKQSTPQPMLTHIENVNR